MDETDLLKTAGLSTTGVAILLIAYRVAKSILGKRLISSCCGKKFEVGVDVETMTPRDVPVVIKVTNPIGLSHLKQKETVQEEIEEKKNIVC